MLFCAYQLGLMLTKHLAFIKILHVVLLGYMYIRDCQTFSEFLQNAVYKID